MQEERYGTRDRAYSAWHRRLSIRRFVGIERAQLLAMIALDASLYVEFDRDEKEPVALIEIARDVGQSYKCATVTARLAHLAGLPCYCVLYTLAEDANPADPSWPDIARFRIRRLWPNPEPEWRVVSPQQWAEALLRVRSWKAAKLDRESAVPKVRREPRARYCLMAPA